MTMLEKGAQAIAGRDATPSGGSNLSVLERNCIHALGAYDCNQEAASMFLRLIDRHGVEEAERRAVEWAEIGDRLSPMIAAAARPFAGRDGGSDHGVRDFIRTRYENMTTT